MLKISLIGQKTKFLFAGLLNTAVDFALLFMLVGLGLNPLVGNYISSTMAMLVSFVANRKFTFKSDNPAIFRQLGHFLFFTFFAAWVLQPLTIYLITEFTESTYELPLAKIIATGVTLVWNYIAYSRRVFKDKSET